MPSFADYLKTMRRVKKLPKELRDHIYRIVALPWAPLHQYSFANIKHFYSAVAFGRPNKVPPLGDDSSSDKSPSEKDTKDQGTDGQDASIQDTTSQPTDNALNSSNIPRDWTASLFQEPDGNALFTQRYGLLDYFKESEYANVTTFTKALEKY